MDIKIIAKKLQRLNGNGLFAQKTFNSYFEQSNITMTVVNVLTEIIEKITNEQFDISIGLRILKLSEDEKIYLIINKNIDMITIKNTKLRTSAVLKTDKFEKKLTKFKALMINDIIYHIFDNESDESIKSQTFMC